MFTRLSISAAFVFAFAALTPACAVSDGSVDPAEDLEVVKQEVQDTTLDGCGGQCYNNNCVGYARCRTQNDNVAGTLPYGLTSYEQKKAACNSAGGRRGCVAVIPTGSYYGHVAYVEDSWIDANGNRRYRLSEADWESAGYCSNRSGTKGGLNINCFWCP